MRTKALTVAGGVVLATAAIGGVAYAEGATPAPSASSAPSSVAASAATAASPTTGAAPAKVKRPARARLHRLAERALHGQFTVERKGVPVVIDAQRGNVTAVSPSSITVRSKDGFTTSYVLTAHTRIRSGGKHATVTALAGGERVAVVGPDDGGHPSAAAIRVLAK